jgi:hypothetical protein
MPTAQYTSVRAKAEDWQRIRIARACQSYYQYRIGESSDPHRAILIAPPVIDTSTGEILCEHYALDTVAERCTCPDQQRLDRLNWELRGSDPGAQLVRCKHWTIWALLRTGQPDFQDQWARETAAQEEEKEWRDSGRPAAPPILATDNLRALWARDGWD